MDGHTWSQPTAKSIHQKSSNCWPQHSTKYHQQWLPVQYLFLGMFGDEDVPLRWQLACALQLAPTGLQAPQFLHNDAASNMQQSTRSSNSHHILQSRTNHAMLITYKACRSHTNQHQPPHPSPKNSQQSTSILEHVPPPSLCVCV